MATDQKRFIAGAVCPRCAELDRLVVYRREGKDFRECVSCDFMEEMHFPPLPRQPATRLTNRSDEAAVSIVKIVTPTKP